MFSAILRKEQKRVVSFGRCLIQQWSFAASRKSAAIDFAFPLLTPRTQFLNSQRKLIDMKQILLASRERKEKRTWRKYISNVQLNLISSTSINANLMEGVKLEKAGKHAIPIFQMISIVNFKWLLKGQTYLTSFIRLTHLFDNLVNLSLWLINVTFKIILTTSNFQHRFALPFPCTLHFQLYFCDKIRFSLSLSLSLFLSLFSLALPVSLLRVQCVICLEHITVIQPNLLSLSLPHTHTNARTHTLAFLFVHHLSHHIPFCSTLFC